MVKVTIFNRVFMKLLFSIASLSNHYFSRGILLNDCFACAILPKFLKTINVLESKNTPLTK
jgi:hypothetical protein